MIDDYIKDVMVREQIPGLSIAVVQGGIPQILKGYGYANLEHQVLATEQTVYEIASIGKTFTLS
jgi:CubicO group peptidase (beta-lactamase class C family)